MGQSQALPLLNVGLEEILLGTIPFLVESIGSLASKDDLNAVENSLRQQTRQLEEHLTIATRQQTRQMELQAEERKDAQRLHALQLQEEYEKQRALMQAIMNQQSATMKDMMEAHREALAKMDEQSRAQMQEMFKVIAGLVATLKEKSARAEQLTRSFTDVMDAPTQFEIKAAMELLGYEDNCLNLAIAGCSGVGKSSFLNALRGCRNDDPRAAKVDYIEATKEIKKYKSRVAGVEIACFDIPGAGTNTFSRYEYFKNQGLYIMDALVIVYSDRLTDTDTDLLRHCIEFKVPYFLVRTKCDNYFDDSNRNDGIRLDFHREMFQTDEMRQRFQVKKDTFRKRVLEEAHNNILDAYKKQQISSPPNVTQNIYLVNRESLQKFISQGKIDVYTMDEQRLLRDLAETVASRRN